MGERVKLEPPPKTGWPPPALMQDDHRGLFRWFASRLGSRRLVRESVSSLMGEMKLEGVRDGC